MRSRSLRSGSAGLALVGLTLGIAACGGSTKTVTTGAGVSNAPAAASVPDCSKVNSRTYMGRCTLNGGSTATFAGPRQAVSLKTIKVRMVGYRLASSLHGSYSSVDARGRFVVVTLAVTNVDNTPQTFMEYDSASQAALLVRNNQYSVRFDAENQVDPHSFVSKSDQIQPGETRVGDVVFDVPTATVPLVSAHGGVLVCDFGKTMTDAQAVAAIRFF